MRCAENPGLGTSHGAVKPQAKGFLKTGSKGNWGGGGFFSKFPNVIGEPINSLGLWG